ncbi:MAG TPA: hypothetical protein DEQ61_01120 [Streptomyces sp.]|nr:hypothetical protein [Streptomyces sp.]
MIRGLLQGALAGAAGTTALNATTYGDMAVRARSSSSTPEQAVDDLAEAVGHPVPGEGEERENRLSGLGALTGIAVGVGTGAVLGVLRHAGLRPPLWLGGAVAGVLAMAVTDLPMARLGMVSDPRSWSRQGWLSDIVPHLAYGYVTCATLQGLERGR